MSDCDQIERWDLIEQRRLVEESPLEETTMKPPPRKLHIDIDELESAFEPLARLNPPPEGLLESFDEFSQPTFAQVQKLTLQNQKLRTARDLCSRS